MNNVPFVPPSIDEFRRYLSRTFTTKTTRTMSSSRQCGSGRGHLFKSVLAPSGTRALPHSSLSSMHPSTRKKTNRKKKAKSKFESKRVKMQRTDSRKRKREKFLKGKIYINELFSQRLIIDTRRKLFLICPRQKIYLIKKHH